MSIKPEYRENVLTDSHTLLERRKYISAHAYNRGSQIPGD
jgi:hypothetical protein